MSSTRILLVAAFAIVSHTRAARAQTPATLPEQIADAARTRLLDPALDAPLLERAPRGRFWRWIEGLRVQFRAFDRFSDDRAALGFTYDFAKAIPAAKDAEGTSFDFVATGNVAFDRDANPDDYLWTALRVRWFGSHTLGSSGDTRKDLVASRTPPTVDELSSLDPERYMDVAARSARGASAREMRNDPDFQVLARRYADSIEHTLPPELVWNGELHLGFESNQDWSSRQTVFGFTLGGRFLSSDPDATASRWNVFDAPAAAVRWLAGNDEKFRLSGTAYPAIALGFDVVDASQDDARRALTDDDSLVRARFEAGMRSAVLDLGDEQLWLSAGWRFFQEVDPEAAIRRADTDHSSHLAIRMDLPRGWALTYTTGRLPLDAQDDSTFALGFDVQF